MADVGVLNLQIHDNSEQTVENLGRVADALDAVKRAVGDGIKLSGIASQLSKIADVVNNNISDTTLNRLRHLTDALQGLQGLGDVRVNIRVTEQVENLRNAIGGATTQVEAMERHFENVARQTETANEAAQDFCRNMRSGMEVVQNTSWINGWEKFRDILYDIMRIKSRMALPGSQDNAMSSSATNGWSFWKNGAIQGEGSVSNPAGYFENVALSVREVKEATREATQTQTDYNRACEEAIEYSARLNREIGEKYRATPPTFEDMYFGVRNGEKRAGRDLMSEWLQGGGNDTERQWAYEEMARQFGMSVDEVKQRCAQLREEAARVAESFEQVRDSIGQTTAIVEQLSAGFNGANIFSSLFQMWNMQRMGSALGSGIAGLLPSGKETIDGGMVTPLEEIKDVEYEVRDSSDNLTDSLKGLDVELKQKKTDAAGAASAFDTLKTGIKGLFKPLTNLLSQFARIAKYRMMRAVLKSIVGGLKEGVENLYWYSKAAGTSFAPAMDSAATSILQMKNSIGASLAPVIQALIPYLQQVVNWFIECVNYANQFFALLRGQDTWTRALPATTQAFTKTEKAAKKTGAALKDLLADWDELNIIQQENSGSGTGSAGKAATDYLKMFEEVGTFNNKVKDVVNFVKQHLDEVKTVAEAIGAAILAWKISKAFGDTLNFMRALELLAGLTLVIDGVKVAAKAGYDIGKNGITGDNITEGVRAVLETALGSAMIAHALIGTTSGALIGLTVGAALGLAILGYNGIEGYYDSLYGDVHKSVEDIKKDLEENYLNIDARAKVNVLRANLKDTQAAQDRVQDAIDELNGSYGVDVLITPDNKEDFSQKVKELVSATNSLIDQQKVNFTLYAPVSGYFTSVTDFQNVMSNAWEGSKEYVTSLGEDIGKILNDGINDQVKLTELRKNLLEISEALTRGQRQGEYESKVAFAGAAIRENNLSGKFDRETVENYIKEYNSISDQYMALAKEAATAEKANRQALVDVLEARKKQGDKTFKQSELDAAIAENKAYNVVKQAQKMFDEWTAGGGAVIAQNIADSLKIAMQNNKLPTFTISKWLTNTLLGNAPGKSDEAVDAYIRVIQESLYNALANGTGMSKEDLQAMLGFANIDPMSLFSDDFTQQFKGTLMTMLANADLTADQKTRIASAFGFSWEDLLTEAEKKIVEKTKASDNNLHIPAVLELDRSNEFDAEVLDTINFIHDRLSYGFKESEFKDDLFGNFSPQAIDAALQVLEEEGEKYDLEVPVDLLTNNQQIKETLNSVVPDAVENMKQKLQAGFKYIHVEPDVELSHNAQLYLQMIENAANSGKGIQELRDANLQAQDMFGVDAFIEALPYINEITRLFKEQYGETGLIPAGGRLASTGVSDSYGMWSKGTPITKEEEAQVEADSNTDLVSKMERSSLKTNGDTTNDLFRDLIRICQTIANKNFVVNVTPSSGMGRVTSKSADMYERVTGWQA